MVEAAAAALHESRGRVVQASIESFAAPPRSVDLVVSRLAFHDVADLATVLQACRVCLAPGGRLVVTVVHPVLTAPEDGVDTDEPRTSWVVDDYFRSGPRVRHWLGGTVVWHHRTIEEHVAAIAGSGFSLTALRECPPRRELLRRRRRGVRAPSPGPALPAARRHAPLADAVSGTGHART